MYIKNLDLLVFNRIGFINTVIIKSTFPTTRHVHLYTMNIGWSFWGKKQNEYLHSWRIKLSFRRFRLTPIPPVRLTIQQILLIPANTPNPQTR